MYGGGAQGPGPLQASWPTPQPESSRLLEGQPPHPPAVPVPLFNYRQRFFLSLDRVTDAHGFAAIWTQFLA